MGCLHSKSTTNSNLEKKVDQSRTNTTEGDVEKTEPTAFLQRESDTSVHLHIAEENNTQCSGEGKSIEDVSFEEDDMPKILPERNSTEKKDVQDSDATASPRRDSISDENIQLHITDEKRIKALYSYDTRSNKDLSFEKGDIFDILSAEDQDWWYAANISTGETGYIRSNYVAMSSSLEAEEWFHGDCTRKGAEKQLNLPEYPPGTFLLRSTETYSVLSIKDYSCEKRSIVRHYKIHKLKTGHYSLKQKTIFNTLQELVEHYSEHSDGLCQKLTECCPKPKPTMWDLSSETKDKWEISRDSLELHDKLETGEHGQMFKGTWNRSIDVAVKRLNPGTLSPTELRNAADIIKKCRHTHLLPLYAVCTSDEPFLVVTELMVNGNLLNYLRHGYGQKFMPEDMLDAAAQIAAGMAYIEEKQLFHGCLDAKTILVGDHNLLKVSDFHLNRIIHKTGGKFPVKWTAPEAAIDGDFTIKSDVWSFGILLIEIVTKGSVPYPGMTNGEVLTQVVDHGYHQPMPTDCPVELYHIIVDCWKMNAIQRPTFDYLQHALQDYSTAIEPQRHTLQSFRNICH